MMLSIENLNLYHIDKIYEIEKACFTVPWSKQAFVDEITRNDLANYYVAIENDEVIGYVGMWHIVDEVHITNVAVLPTHRRKGVASTLISRVIDYAVENDISGVTLEVRESNESAIKLYENFGFEKIGVRKNYYSKPRENAIIMWKIMQVRCKN